MLDAELAWRGLEAFSRSQPSLTKATTLPIVEHSELNAWPAKQTFIHPFGPPPLDYNTTSEWGRTASARRRAADAKVDQELQEMERQREEFYQGR